MRMLGSGLMDLLRESVSRKTTTEIVDRNIDTTWKVKWNGKNQCYFNRDM